MYKLGWDRPVLVTRKWSALMVLKRSFFGDEDGADNQESKRFKKVVPEMLNMPADFASSLERFIRTVVRDEVEKTVTRVLQSFPSTSFNRRMTSRGRGFILQFVNKLPSTIFTGSRVEGTEGKPIKIALLDANSKSVVSSGPQSSLKVEIVVLDGGFCSNENDDRSKEHFSANIIREREGRRPLITGELTFSLRDGFAEINDVVFTDNSSWQRSGKFRLGVRIVQKLTDKMMVREGRSEAFRVKDQRGEVNRKHYPPRSADHIWRLNKIAKDGAFHQRLASNGVYTIGDFLQLSTVNPSKLRMVLGCGISNKIWDTIMKHASSCVPDDGKLYSYIDVGLGVELLFNSIYKLVAVTFDGQNLLPLHKLSASQKVLVENGKRHALENVNELTLIDVGPGSSRLLKSLQEEPLQDSNVTMQQIQFPVANQGRPELEIDFNNSSSSTSYGYYEHDISSQVEVSVPKSQAVHNLRNSFRFDDVIPFLDTGHDDWSQNGWQVGTSGHLTSHEGVSVSALQTSTFIHDNLTWGQGIGNVYMFLSGNEGDLGSLFSYVPNLGVHMARTGKPRASWCKLRAALMCKSLRRDVANRKVWEGFCVD